MALIKEGETMWELILKMETGNQELHYAHRVQAATAAEAVRQCMHTVPRGYVVTAIFTREQAHLMHYSAGIQRPDYDELCAHICAGVYVWPRDAAVADRKGKPRREPDHAPFWWDLPSVTEDNAAALGESFMDVVRKMSGDTK